MNKGKYLIRKSSRFIIFYVITILFIVIGSSQPAPAEPPGFTIEQILAAPFPSSLTAAPSGQRIAWVFSDRGVKNLWTAMGPDFKARRLTQFSKDDGRPLTIRGFSSGNGFIIISKGGRFNPDHNPGGSGETIIYRVDCSTGKMEEIVKAGRAAVSPCTDQLVFVKGGDLFIVSPGQKPEKKVSSRGNLSLPKWSPDGRRLVFVSFRGEFPHRYSYIMVYDLGKDKVN